MCVVLCRECNAHAERNIYAPQLASVRAYFACVCVWEEMPRHTSVTHVAYMGYTYTTRARAARTGLGLGQEVTGSADSTAA